nr:hypothetical protein [uncultured Desulfobacter sp.]
MIKNKKIFLLYLLLMQGIVLCSSPVKASSYYIYDYYDTWSSTWSDANKSSSNSDDNYLCWAAAASNILYWSGRGNVEGAIFDSSQDIFDYFQYYWSDEGGNPRYAYYWWFTGTNLTDGIDGWAQVEINGGGGFWDLSSFNAYYWSSYYYNSSTALSALSYFWEMDTE